MSGRVAVLLPLTTITITSAAATVIITTTIIITFVNKFMFKITVLNLDALHLARSSTTLKISNKQLHH